MIIVSDMELGGGHTTVTGGGAPWVAGSQGTGKTPHGQAGAHLSPGMSSRLVIPVQLMSKVWGEWGQMRGADPSCLGGAGAAGPCGEGRGGATHRAPDEEHGEGPHDRHVPQEGLQDDPQHPMELGGAALRCHPHPMALTPPPRQLPMPPAPTPPSPPSWGRGPPLTCMPFTPALQKNFFTSTSIWTSPT